MKKAFSGFNENDFKGIRGTTWRKDLGEVIQTELTKLLGENIHRRIPYMWSTVYWGNQKDFKVEKNFNCYSKLYASIYREKRLMDFGLYIEKGFEDEASIKNNNFVKEYMPIRKVYWDWYRFEEQLKSIRFCAIIQELLDNGFSLDICIKGDLDNPISLRQINDIHKLLDLWKKSNLYQREWGDILIYKRYNKDSIIRMKGYIVNEMMDSFKALESLYRKVTIKQY